MQDSNFTGGTGTVATTDYLYIEIYNHVDGLILNVKDIKLELNNHQTAMTLHASDSPFIGATKEGLVEVPFSNMKIYDGLVQANEFIEW